MTAPNMEAITASLERSLQNCSLSHHQHHRSNGVYGGGRERSSSSDDPDSYRRRRRQQQPEENHDLGLEETSDTTLELNSNLSLPYHWEQCLDLKTGEIYYINWRNGMKAKEYPQELCNGEYYSEDDESSYSGDESSSESSPSSSRDHCNRTENNKQDHVLVVAGCKICFMYFMVPKQVEDCPKCSGQLLHFDRSENGSP